MTLFLEDTVYKNDKNVVIIEPMPKVCSASFLSIDDINILEINEQKIKNIYSENIDEFIVLFHELNHFKVEYEIKTGLLMKI